VLSKLAPVLALLASLDAQVLTSQYDNARTNATLHETVLTPANVDSRQFGRIFQYKVDGDVYAQPLFLPNVEVPGKGTHNVIYIATEHDSVYAFDAAGHPADPLWRVNFLGQGRETVPARDVRCGFISPEIGITPTPAIDLDSGTIYILARTLENGTYVHKLHALAITTGVEKFGGPVAIQASGFDARRELPRAALLLSKGQVYLTWGSSCDVGPYHGWVMAYDAHKLTQTAVFNTSPEAEESGIWQSDNGPAADAEGNVYVSTGNGKFTVPSGGHDYGDSALKLALGPGGLVVRDYFTPSDQQRMNTQDADMGSAGPMLLPDQPGSHPHLVLSGAKNSVLYVMDRDRMGKYQSGSDSHAVQTIRFEGGIYAAPAYWNGHVFMLASGDYLRDFTLRQGLLDLDTVKKGVQRFANAGANPTVSADGARNGIVWLVESKTWNGRDKPAILHAYDASNIATEIYHTEQNSDRDRVGLTLRFTVPTVVNGRVYVDAKNEIDVYGLLPPARP
jgi:hypothetical protein